MNATAPSERLLTIRAKLSPMIAGAEPAALAMSVDDAAAQIRAELDALEAGAEVIDDERVLSLASLTLRTGRPDITFAAWWGISASRLRGWYGALEALYLVRELHVRHGARLLPLRPAARAAALDYLFERLAAVLGPRPEELPLVIDVSEQLQELQRELPEEVLSRTASIRALRGVVDRAREEAQREQIEAELRLTQALPAFDSNDTADLELDGEAAPKTEAPVHAHEPLPWLAQAWELRAELGRLGLTGVHAAFDAEIGRFLDYNPTLAREAGLPDTLHAWSRSCLDAAHEATARAAAEKAASSRAEQSLRGRVLAALKQARSLQSRARTREALVTLLEVAAAGAERAERIEPALWAEIYERMLELAGEESGRGVLAEGQLAELRGRRALLGDGDWAKDNRGGGEPS